MGSLKDVVSDAKVEAVHAVVETNGQKYLCFTRLTTDAWILCVSDGFDLWRLELDMEELDAHRDLAEVASIDAFLARFRVAFTSHELQVSQGGVKLSLSVGSGSKALHFDLYEAKAIEKRTELQTVLFRLAESVTDLDSKLATVNRQLETAKQQKATTAASSGIFDMDSNKKKAQQKAVAKTVGMSVLNPGSKKRKAAQGVVFD